ncbi:hypothetical protein OUZ56_008691 [Daphnia magna]|uniref:Peptidase A2 domain-containing protein n=1 Tax=Daphnia magna TaxID=35525 RepID=A0ABR0ADR3_9CRUS|nr:hypothetical protein OUZ56_008691 [Daphnia magna]
MPLTAHFLATETQNKTDVANDAANQDATKIKEKKWWKLSSSKKVEVKPVFNDIKDVLETPEELSHKAGPETCTPKSPEKTRENGNNNPDADADIENEKPTRTEGKKWWFIFSSKTKKTKTISGDTRQQRDGQKKKKWWKFFSSKTKTVDLTLDQPKTECVLETQICEKKFLEPPYNPIYLSLMLLSINGLGVNMFIDSGCHASFITESMWKQMGKPKLEPPEYKLKSGILGGGLNLIGHFMATVRYRHREFKLPLLVTSQSNRFIEFHNLNILGRVWLCCINLDWNRFFHTAWNKVMSPVNVDFRYETTNMMKLALELKSCCNSQCPSIKVRMEGVDIKMFVDTGSYDSSIGWSVWKALGKPKLEKTKTVLIAPNGRKTGVKGTCFVNVEYSGQKCFLPLLD